MKAWDTPLEKDIENYFVRQVKKHGGRPEKFTSPGRRSVPDRIVSQPHGRIWFCELKRPGARATTKQLADHEERRAMGFNVWVCSTKAEVDYVIEIEMGVDRA